MSSPGRDEAASRVNPYVQMLGASLSFSFMAAGVHALGQELHWSVVTFCRMAFGVVLLYAIARARGVPILFTGPPALWIRAIAGSAGMIGNFYALTRLPVSDALAIFHTVPIWVAVIRKFVFKESLTSLQWLCVFGAVGGVFVSQEFSLDLIESGAFSALLGAVFTAFAFISMSFLGGYHPQSVTMHFSFFASLVALGAILINRPETAAILPSNAFQGTGLIAVAAFGSLAQVLMTSAMARGHNVTVSVIGLTQILFAAIFDLTVWHRTFSPTKLLGFALIAICVVLLTTHRPAAAKR